MLLADLPVVTPDAVLHLPQDTRPGGQCWWLLWTDPTREKWVSGDLAAEGAVPLIITNIQTRTRQNGAGRDFKVRKEVNLFKGYLFANGTDIQVFNVKDTQWERWGQAVHLMKVKGQATTAAQISRMMAFSASHADLTAERLVPGRAVEVMRGPWTGCRGILVNATPARSGMVYLPIETMGQMVETEIPADFVEPI